MIRYTFIQSGIGPVLIAARANGVCTIALGDSEVEMENRLRLTHGSEPIENDPGLAVWADGIANLIEGRPCGVDIPLDPVGTLFQHEVWRALRAIPRGETRSYAEIARGIDRPRAFRAVAQACGANPIPLVIPCHRVIASDGSLGGFSAGVERKAYLLDRERG